MPSRGWRTRRQLFCDLAIAAAALAAGPLVPEARAAEPTAERIVVLKTQRLLMLIRGETCLAAFPVALGARPIGPKRRQGDARTPEGLYRIDALNPQSRFHRAFHLSYPNLDDLLRAREAGVAPGGNIEIHGLPPGFADYDPTVFYKDWTDGCIAVSNRSIDELWTRVAVGTPVEIRA